MGGEHLGRALVYCEYTESRRIEARDAASSYSKPISPLEKQLMRGNRASRTQTIIPQEFLQGMVSEMKVEADKAKSVRKHKEELRLEAERLEKQKKEMASHPVAQKM